jgi:hypothetical protein
MANMRFPLFPVWLLVGCWLCFQCQAQVVTNAATNVPARSFLGIGGITRTPERRASPLFAGTELPQPPQQGAPWTAPASAIPTNYITASTALFNLGLADPRGCDYREIEVGTGNVWSGDNGVVKTHGWVFAGKDNQQFAVCWNGLVYPVVHTGEAADWRADARAFVGKVQRQFRKALPEEYEISHESCRPIKGCLLLRLGEPKLADDLWLAIQLASDWDLISHASQAGVSNSIPVPASKAVLSTNDPYLNWASDWAWSLFERTVCAHMRGDDRLALATARLLDAARPKIEKESGRRGFQRQESVGYNRDSKKKYEDYLPFLEDFTSLLNDQKRRAHDSKADLEPQVTISKMTNQTERIAAWIDALDQVRVRQCSQPGGLDSWKEDPIVAGLLKEGEPAIEPLLRCLESGSASRLTRSISFGRDFLRSRTLHHVSEPVIVLLLNLMNASPEAVGLEGNARASWRNGADVASAYTFREYWRTYGPLSLPERWYRKLADDAAGPGAWADALKNIVRADDGDGHTNSGRLAGEVLRSKKSPTVTELLLNRSASILEPAYGGAFYALQGSVSFLLDSERWEASAPLLKQAAQLQVSATSRYTEVPHNSRRSFVSSRDSRCIPQDAQSIALLAMLRARHGDTQGLAEYAQWICNVQPIILENFAMDALEPFWRFPEDPALRTAAKEMFANTNSPWGTLAWLLEEKGSSLRTRQPLASAALIIPEFRLLVVNELTNRMTVGEVVSRGNGSLEVKYPSGAMYYGGRKDADGLEVGKTLTFRRCDVVAEQLSTIKGFPSFSLVWPEAKRDEAVAATLKLLKESGARLKPVNEKWRMFSVPHVELSATE